GSTAYLADGWGGLRIIDVSDPAAPRMLGTSPTTAWAMDVAIAGGKAYLAAGAQGLRILSVGNPQKPILLGAIAMKTGHAAHVLVRNGVAYVSDIFKGLRVVNVNSPARPRAVGVYVPLGIAQDLSLRGRYAFVAAKSF